MRGRSRLILLLASAVLIASCAEAPRRTPGAQPPTPNRYEANATVIEFKAGPELCLGLVLDSLPPQCGGPPLVGWSWDDVDGERTRGGVTWGEYHVVGTYDGSAFTVIGAGPTVPFEPEGDPFQTPCPEPAAGWIDVDPSTTGEEDRTAAMKAAEAIPEYAGLWIDYIEEPIDYEAPGPYILNVAFAGDPDRFEGDIRDAWGGPLCLVSFDHSFRELQRIQNDLSAGGADAIDVEVLGVSVDMTRNQVELDVVVVDPGAEAALAETYGKGTVRLVPALGAV